MDWILKPRKTPPPEGVLVEVKGCDFMGEWVSTAYRLDYKKGSTKGQLKRKWRWIKDGSPFNDHEIEAWRPIQNLQQEQQADDDYALRQK